MCVHVRVCGCNCVYVIRNGCNGIIICIICYVCNSVTLSCVLALCLHVAGLAGLAMTVIIGSIMFIVFGARKNKIIASSKGHT